MSDTPTPKLMSMRDWTWSPSEKAIARRAFDDALHRELEAVVREAKDRVANIREADELWKLESWLAERRKKINDTFDFRYSVLPMVFAGLIHAGRLDEEELHGLAPDKLDAIRRMTTF